MKPEKDGETRAPWWLELIKIVPSVLWVALALYAFNLFRDQILTAVSRWDVTKIVVAMIQIEFACREISAIEGSHGVQKTPEEFKPLEERIKRTASKIVGAHVIWVDNHPEHNVRERLAFSLLRV